MIGSFRHKGLRQLFEDDIAKGVNPDHVRKLKQILLVLQASRQIEGLNVPTFRLHPLTGELKGLWSINRARKLAGDFPVRERHSIRYRLGRLPLTETVT